MPTSSQNYQGLPLIEVRIVTVSPNRLIVRLPDGRKGIIPQKEWTGNRSVRTPRLVFKENEKVLAVEVPGKTKSARPYLSIRECVNPWEGISARWKVGQVTIGEVVHLRRFAAYIQIEEGITAVLWTKDMPVLPEQIPGDMLHIGDRVQVQMMKIDLQKQSMEVSMIQPLIQADTAIEAQKKNLLQLFKPRLQEQKNNLLPLPGNQKQLVVEQFAIRSLGKLRTVLIVDDQEDHAQRVGELIKEEYDCNIVIAQDRIGAFKQVKKHKKIDLVLIDLNLGVDDNGTALAKELLKQFPYMPLVFISTAASAIEDVLQLEEELKRPFPFAEKPLNWQQQNENIELLGVIYQLQQGIIEKKRHVLAKPELAFIEELEEHTLESSLLSEQLDTILEDLARSTLIEFALVLELDREEKKFDLLASYTNERDKWLRGAIDGLYYSPIRDVVESGDVFYMGATQEEADLIEIRNLFPELSFRSGYGVPIKIPGMEIRHVLLVLDKRPDLSWNNILHIRSTAAFLGLALEQDRLLKVMRQQHDRYLQGQLFNCLLHELRNHFQPILNFANDSDLSLEKYGVEDFSQDFKTRIKPGINRLNDLILSYGRLDKNELEKVDMNAIINKVYQQLKPLANQYNIHLVVDQSQALPPVLAVALHLEQTLTNVVLNAIQQVKEQKEYWRKLEENNLSKLGIIPQRVVLITSCIAEDENYCCIGVIDAGPGVPYPLRDKIFHSNFTTRKEGQGLGLYISKNLIQAMGGRIEWIESIRCWGSIFSLVFPIKK